MEDQHKADHNEERAMKIRHFVYGFGALMSIGVIWFGVGLYNSHTADRMAIVNVQPGATIMVEATIRPKPRPSCFPTSCAPTTSPWPMPRPAAVEAGCADEPECLDDHDFHYGSMVDIDEMIKNQFGPILVAIQAAQAQSGQ